MSKTSKNDITGDWIQSKPNSDMFEKNFDLIFRQHLKEHKETWNGEYLEYYPDAVVRLSQFQ